mmetsp:Transcript_26092/g.47065  ORF Transcript_26092/g.47065 Transcript_26092/m.47065 type:complete len:246 (-) Transcript_26092:652-1389(-)
MVVWHFCWSLGERVAVKGAPRSSSSVVGTFSAAVGDCSSFFASPLVSTAVSSADAVGPTAAASGTTNTNIPSPLPSTSCFNLTISPLTDRGTTPNISFPPVFANVTIRLASFTTYSLPSSDGTPAASWMTFDMGLMSVIMPWSTNSVRRRKHIRRGRPEPDSGPPLSLPSAALPLTQERRVGIRASANVGYRRCISTQSMTIPGTSACFTFVCGSINALATSSTYLVKFNVLMGLFGLSNSFDDG